MNDTTNSQGGGGSFGGNNNSGNGSGNNPFNTNVTNGNNNQRPNVTPLPAPVPSNLPTGNNTGNQNIAQPPQPQQVPQSPSNNFANTNANANTNTPKFSGMPAPASRPFQSQSYQSPQFSPPPRPAAPSVVSMSSPPPKPQTLPAFTPKPTIQTVKGSSKGLVATIIIIVIIILAVATLWFLKPFSLSQGANTIEDKVANPENRPAANDSSAFPTGVVNTNKAAATSGTTASKPVKSSAKSSNTYSVSDQNAITSYLKQNINKLAKSSGYVVADMTFDGPGRGVVTYSKASATHSAVVNAYVDSAGKVIVTSFAVLTK